MPAPAVTAARRAAAECARAVAQAQPLPTGDEGGPRCRQRARSSGRTPPPVWPSARTFGEHKALVLGLAFSSDGRTLASASGDKTIKLWPVFGGPEPSSPPLQNGSMESVAFLPGRDLLASASDDGSVRLWHTDTGKEACPRTLEFGTAVRSVAFSPDGGLLAAAGDVGRVKLVDLAEGGVCRRWITGARRARRDLLLGRAAPGLGRGRSTGQAVDGTWREPVVRPLRPWEGREGRDLLAGRAAPGLGRRPTDHPVAGVRRPAGAEMEHGDQVWALTFSPDGRLLASAGADGKVKLWEVVRGREIRALDGHTTRQQGLAFSPDGRLLATADGAPSASGAPDSSPGAPDDVASAVGL